MSDMMQLTLALLTGMLLGLLFFGGLWWTVLKGLSAKQPALWFGISLLLRTGITLVGLYFVAGRDWRQLLACMAGLIIARMIVIRLTSSRIVKEMSHAP